MTEIITIAAAVIVMCAALFYHRITIRTQSTISSTLQGHLQECEELLAYASQKEKRVLDEMAEARKITAELLSKLSHEIRTPMNGVMGMAAMLSSTPLNTEQKKYLQIVISCSESLVQSVNKILVEYSSKESNVINNNSTELMQSPFAPGHIDEDVAKLTDTFSSEYPLNILVGEDNKMNEELITMILKRLGYCSDVACNGRQAMEMMKARNYDLVFMDVQMPELDGIEATKMIRLCMNTQPVIVAMTANAMPGDREKYIRVGMDDYISKPLNIGDLVVMLAKWASHINERVRTRR